MDFDLLVFGKLIEFDEDVVDVVELVFERSKLSDAGELAFDEA